MKIAQTINQVNNKLTLTHDDVIVFDVTDKLNRDSKITCINMSFNQAMEYVILNSSVIHSHERYIMPCVIRSAPKTF